MNLFRGRIFFNKKIKEKKFDILHIKKFDILHIK